MFLQDEMGRGSKPHEKLVRPHEVTESGVDTTLQTLRVSSSMTRWNASQTPLEPNAATSGGYSRRTDRFPANPAMRSSRPRRRVVCPVTLGAMLVFCIMLVLAARGIRKNDHMDLLLASGGTSRVKERRAIDSDLPRKVRAQGQLWEADTSEEEDERDSWFKSDDEGQTSDSSDSEKDSEEDVANEKEGWMGNGREDASATSLDGNVNEKDTSLVDTTGSVAAETDDQMKGEDLLSKRSSVENEDSTLETVTTQKTDDEIPQAKEEKTEQLEDQESQGNSDAVATAHDKSGSITRVKRVAYDFDDLQFDAEEKTDEGNATSQTKSQGNREDEVKTLADFYEERYEEMMREEKKEKAEKSEHLQESNVDEGEQMRKGNQNTESLKAGNDHSEERDKDEITASGSVSKLSTSTVAAVGIQDQAAIINGQERQTFANDMSASDISNENTSSEAVKHQQGIQTETISKSVGASQVVRNNAEISRTVEENEILELEEDTGAYAENQAAFSRSDDIDASKSDVDGDEALSAEDPFRDNEVYSEEGAEED